MEATSNALFSIGPLEVTKTVVTMWVIIVVLGLVSWLATRRLKNGSQPHPECGGNGGDQAAGLLYRYYGARQRPPIFPGDGHLFHLYRGEQLFRYSARAGHGFAVPTANLSTTAGLAIIAFFTTHIVGVKRRGVLGYLKTFISPLS